MQWSEDLISLHFKTQIFTCVTCINLRKIFNRFKLIEATHLKTVVTVCHCVVSTLLWATVCKHLGTKGEKAAEHLGKQCCPSLVWYSVLGSQESCVYFVILIISWCSKCFPLVKSLDCRQDSSAPGLFKYKAILL